jgi:hypothetical protein
MLDIVQNPMFIAIVIGTLTYLYMNWVNNKKIEQDPKYKRPVNIIIPGVVTAITWLLVYGYYTCMLDGADMSKPQANSNVNMENPNMMPTQNMQNYKLAEDNMMNGGNNSDTARSFQLLGRGMSVPNNLKVPDVFIETY